MVKNFIIWIWNYWENIMGTQYKLCECGCGYYFMASPLDFLLWVINLALFIVTVAAVLYGVYKMILFFSKNMPIKKMVIGHFNNRPLKFEELEEGNILWDNLEKEFLKVECKSISDIGVKYISCTHFGTDYESFIPFEENRFFREQVAE